MPSHQNEQPPAGMSIVIPTIGRGEVLLETVRGLQRQTDVEFEIIIVTQSDDQLEELQECVQDNGTATRCFYQPEPNASLARNVGLIQAQHEVVLFMDDDMQFVTTDYLRSHLAPYVEPQLSGVVGQVLSPNSRPRTRPLHRFVLRDRVGWLYFPFDSDKNTCVRSGISCNLSVRRKFAIEIGGMDAFFVKGAHREESEFCLRLTDRYGPLLFSTDASAVHLRVPEGGSRSWNEQAATLPNTYAPHHLTGEWYFILRGLKLGTIQHRELPDHLLAAFRRQVLHRPNGHRVRGLLDALQKSFSAYRLARQQVKQPPRTIEALSHNDYRLLWEIA